MEENSTKTEKIQEKQKIGLIYLFQPFQIVFDFVDIMMQGLGDFRDDLK